MKIALIGTGKMGAAVEAKAKQAGHEIVLQINHLNRHHFSHVDLKKADVAIEFTQPDAVVSNLFWCLEAGVPVVCGTTGWQEQAEGVFEKFRIQGGGLLTATNFSIGVNLLFRLNRELAKWMKSHPEYIPFLEETHHTAKLDKPSGTALTMAGDVIKANPHVNTWSLCEDESSRKHNVLSIHSVRKDAVIGEHEMTWTSPIDKISLRHEAFNRDGFAAGALLAAEWLRGHKGVFSMEDVLFGEGK